MKIVSVTIPYHAEVSSQAGTRLELDMKSEIKAEYLRTLQEYVDERLYITDRIDEFQLEFDSNCWHINGSKEEIQSLDLGEWMAFIRHLINDRQKQLNSSHVGTDLVIYFWHDDMAGQLRFNVITANHSKLPFSEITITEGNYVVDMSAESGEEDVGGFVAKVYVEKIRKT